MDRVACVYAICNLSTGEAYIGITGDLSHRWNGHRIALRRSRHWNRRMQEAWQRDGEESFGLVILERLAAEAIPPLDAACYSRERSWQARARFAGVGLYNIASIGRPRKSQEVPE